MTGGFAVRGIIEGFYGVPWTHEQRLDMIEFIGGLGLNTYVYAPKDDPYLRRDWRVGYAAESLSHLAELITQSQLVGVTMTYALSPGLSMRYSLDEDFVDLLNKYRQVHELGVTSFALLLDDIPGVLQHPLDRATYPSLAAAQSHLVTRLYEALIELDADAALVICPTTYWGRGDEPYLAELGQGIPAAVDMYFTGRAICSAEIDVEDAERFAATTGHAPLYWDNFPVNDVAMTGELHIGPYRGRARALGEVSRGIIANAMPLAEASKIAFSAIADYLSDPHGYDEESSWLTALERVAGARDTPSFRVFADTVRGSCLCADDAPQLMSALERYAFDSEFSDRKAAIGELQVEIQRLARAASDLRSSGSANDELMSEVDPWLRQFERGIQALATTTTLLAEGPLDDAGRRIVFAELESLRESRLRVFGDALDMFLSDLAEEFVRR